MPGDLTVKTGQTNIDLETGDFTFGIPIFVVAMDAVIDVNFVTLMNKLGGLTRRVSRWTKADRSLSPTDEPD